MNFELLQVQIEGVVAVVTINRPEALNALNAIVLSSLRKVLEWIEKDPQAAPIKAVILTGSGAKAFVAGADIKEFESMNAQAGEEFARHGQRLFTAIEELRVPVIAAVNGFALGGGLELALACDFIYASENAKFALPECSLGIMPGFGGTVRLPRRIGPGRAREMTFTGGMIAADEAMRIGLVNRVVTQVELLKSALETANLIASRAPLGICKIKKSIHQGASLSEEHANEFEAKLFGELFASQDKNEGVRAFVEKRKASFQGR